MSLSQWQRQGQTSIEIDSIEILITKNGYVEFDYVTQEVE